MGTGERIETAILGGGISGLTSAFLLSKKPDSGPFVLFEESNRLGGVIQTTRRDGYLLEHGPDCFLSTKPQAKNLCEELGLGPHLMETKRPFRRSFIARGGKLVAVPEGLYLMAPSALIPFLRSPLLSFAGKLRALMDLWIPRKKDEREESLGSFVRRRLGREALEQIAQPMIAGIYGADPDELSLAATMPQFLEMEKEHGSVIRGLRSRSRAGAAEEHASGPRYSLFLTLTLGMQELTDALAARVPAGRIRKNTAAKSLHFERQTASWRINLESGESISAENVHVALPAWKAAPLFRDSDPELSRLLESIPYGSVGTLNLGFSRDQIEHPLHGSGFVVPKIENRSLIACTFCHQKFEGRVPVGKALLRVFIGEPHLSSMNDEEIERAALADLRDYLGIRGNPEFSLFSRYPRSLPQYRVGHLRLISQIREQERRLPGLSLMGGAYAGVGIPDTIVSALDANRRNKPGKAARARLQ